MAKRSWNTDRILGLSAMLISILTLIIFIYQTNIMRKQSRLSVQPRLILGSSSITADSSFVYRQNLMNKGLGPAIIESVTIIYQDQRFEARYDDLIDQYFPDFADYGHLASSTYLSTGSTMSADETQNLFTVEIPIKNLPNLYEYLNIDPEEDLFDVEVIYSSIYKERWKIDTKDSLHPVEL